MTECYRIDATHICSDFKGYSELLKINDYICAGKDSPKNIDFVNVTFFEANLCAALGAICADKSGYIFLFNVKERINEIFQKNRFSVVYNVPSIDDTYNTTVQYKNFDTSDIKGFRNYIENDLLAMRDFPEISGEVRIGLIQNMFEAVENARTHGKASRIYTCGQYYPNKNHKLDFTIADIGETIKSKVSGFLKKAMSGADAIAWAVAEGHTTKSDTGGLGFSLIREFLALNNGKLQIVSADGYWEECQGDIIQKEFTSEFPGVILNFEFTLSEE